MKKALHVAAVCVLGFNAGAQGTFQNLDFEEATYTGQGQPTAPELFPGWTVGGSGALPFYNGFSIGAPAVSLMGPTINGAVGLSPLQGLYSVELQYFGGFGDGVVFDPPTLSQTGMIPANVQSINFLVAPGLDDAVVEVNGESIPLFPVAGGRLAGNISAWSGQTVQLTFTTPTTVSGGGDFLYFDDIALSPTALPEPSSLLLVSATLVLLGRLKLMRS